MLVTVTDYARLSCEQAVPIEELDRVLAAAERDIHAITYERSAGTLTEHQLCIVQQCIVDQADFRFKYAAMLDNPLASYGINGVWRRRNMNIGKVTVCENCAQVSEQKLITSGLVGATVDFVFDDTWAGYKKTYVWKAGDTVKDDTTASGIVPAEMLSMTGEVLWVGVYGVSGDVIIPTIWAKIGAILPGADPSGDETTDPTLPVWAQVQEGIERLEAASAQAVGAAERAAEAAQQAAEVIDKVEEYPAPDQIADKQYVEEEIATFDFVKIVTELPETGLVNRTYFVPKTTAESSDLYDEFMWVNDAWEYIGTKQIEVDLTEYVKNTDYATSSRYGLFKFDAYSHMTHNSGQTGLRLVAATQSEITKREYGSQHAPITCSNFIFAVKTALSSNAEWTDEEKAAAQERLGVGEQLGDIETALDSILAMQAALIGGDAE